LSVKQNIELEFFLFNNTGKTVLHKTVYKRMIEKRLSRQYS